jgi:hypothetical protein
LSLYQNWPRLIIEIIEASSFFLAERLLLRQPQVSIESLLSILILSLPVPAWIADFIVSRVLRLLGR